MDKFCQKHIASASLTVPHAFVVVVVRIEEEVHRIAGEDVEMAEAGRPFEEEGRGNWEEGLIA